MAEIINLFSFAFQMVVLAIVGGIAIWGGLKLSRSISASRRLSAMNQEALVAAARARASQRNHERLVA